MIISSEQTERQKEALFTVPNVCNMQCFTKRVKKLTGNHFQLLYRFNYRHVQWDLKSD